MKTNLFVLFLFIFSSLIFSQIAYTFRYPEGCADGRDVPPNKGALQFLSQSERHRSFHPGVDLNKAGTSFNEDEGEPVMAVAPGKVMDAYFQLPKWGNIIRIRHLLPDSTIVFSSYAHLKCIYVTAGDMVSWGDTIGRVGRGPGRMFPAHLHIEIRKGCMANLPASFFPAGKSRAWVKEHYFDPIAFLKSRSVYPPLAIRDSDMEVNKKIRHRKTKPAAGNIQLVKAQKIIPDTVAQFVKTESEIYKVSLKAESTVADQTSVKNSIKIDSLIWRLKGRFIPGEKQVCRPSDFVINKAIHQFLAAGAISPDWESSGWYKFELADNNIAIVPASRYF
jgi:murein DD-endopeptidase MepM/ murein hydrolase activator NlpD